MTKRTEKTYVEEPFLAHLERLGWIVIRSEGKKLSRADFDEVYLDDEVKCALAKLNPWLTENQIEALCTDIHTFSGTSLLARNKEADERLGSGFSAIDEDTGEEKTVHLIDFKTPCNNSFIAISQYRIQRLEKEIIPDIVLFINGLPLVVIECKSPSLQEPIPTAISQLERYKTECAELFNYNQFIVATDREVALYATLTGKREHYLEWKDPYPFALAEIEPDGNLIKSQERLVWGMLCPVNFIDIVRNYIVWDDGIKKVPRYMQYRGARKIIEALREGKCGGTIWHTQGTGKSLTMMHVIRQMYHYDEFNDWKIVLIVDRDDLEKQLRATSRVTGHDINVAGNIKHAESLINSNASDISIIMVHKFGERKDKSGNTITFNARNNSDKILIMIDEAHRSEYGELAASMWLSMPNAVKIAFTGTPITATTETFGCKIDTYTMRQAVEDGVVVEIRYEGRATNSAITDPEALNTAFLDVFNYEDDEKKQEIMGKYTLKGYMEASEVIAKKAADMLRHYVTSVFPNGFKAQVAAFSREAAYRYREAFRALLPQIIAELKVDNPLNIDIAKLEKLKVECILSGNADDKNKHPHLEKVTQETDNELIISEKGTFKKPFDEGGEVGIIVVADMLLTGFDAPIEQVLYLDKLRKEHNLLQAIARVNRTNGADKKCGYVVDYVGITNHLKDALAEYADDNSDSDIDPLEIMANIQVDIDRLNAAYNEIISFIRDKVQFDVFTHTESVIEELVGDKELCEEFNGLFSALSKYYDRVLPNPSALTYKEGIGVLSFIRQSVANRTRDSRYSMTDASAKVRAIIEKYLAVKGIGVEVPPIDILSSDFINATEKPEKSDRAIIDELTFAVTEYINENKPKDPELYERFAERLAKILEEFKNNWAALRNALKAFIKHDLYKGRKQEESYGFVDPNNSLPFFSLLRRELFGERGFEDLTEAEMNALKDFTSDCVSRLETDAKKSNFWGQESQIKQLRADLRKKMFDLEAVIPSLIESNKANDVVQRVIELGKERFK